MYAIDQRKNEALEEEEKIHRWIRSVFKVFFLAIQKWWPARGGSVDKDTLVADVLMRIDDETGDERGERCWRLRTDEMFQAVEALSPRAKNKTASLGAIHVAPPDEAESVN